MKCCSPDSLAKVPKIIDLKLDSEGASDLYCAHEGRCTFESEPVEEADRIVLCSFPSILDSPIRLI